MWFGFTVQRCLNGAARSQFCDDRSGFWVPRTMVGLGGSAFREASLQFGQGRSVIGFLRSQICDRVSVFRAGVSCIEEDSHTNFMGISASLHLLKRNLSG